MAERTIDYANRRAQREDLQRRVARIEVAFAEPYRRERSRDPEEARLLRERGTPERLIGPSGE